MWKVLEVGEGKGEPLSVRRPGGPSVPVSNYAPRSNQARIGGAGEAGEARSGST